MLSYPFFGFYVTYLHKKSYDEDSILLPKSILQSVEQSAVPVDQVELETDRKTTGHKLYVRGHCLKQVKGTVVRQKVSHHQLGVTEGFQNGLLCQVYVNWDKGVNNPLIRPDCIYVIDKTEGV